MAKIIACDPPESLHRSRECGDRPGQPGWCGEAADIVGFRQQVSRPPLCMSFEIEIFKEGKINLEGDISSNGNVDVIKSFDSLSYDAQYKLCFDRFS